MYNTTAKGLAALGRNGDSTLMHVNKDELAGLQRLLGPLSNNPDTGLPEAFAWGPIMGIIGGLAGSTLALGLGAAVAEPIQQTVTDNLGETAGSIAKVAGPALTSGLVNAGLNYALGGKDAALGGFAQGAMMGGLGGLEANTLLGTEGSAPTIKAADITTTPPSDPFTALSGDRLPQATPVGGRTIADALGAQNTSTPQGNWAMDNVLNTQNVAGSTTPIPTTPPPAAPPQGFFDKVGSNLSTLGDKYGNLAGMKSLASDYGSPAFLSAMVGQGLTQEAYDKKRADEAKQRYGFQDYMTRQNANNLANSLYGPGNNVYGYAAGGPMTIHSQGGYPVSMTIPGPQVEEIQNMGGVAGLMQYLRGMSTGGYINTAPMPADPYPQSQIPRAQPYPAASPQRHEVVGFEDGGFLDGPGDGQSDSIPASIDGVEPIKVADGEFVVPKHIVDMIGVDALDKLLSTVRKNSYGTDQQVPRDAGKLAAERLLARYA